MSEDIKESRIVGLRRVLQERVQKDRETLDTVTSAYILPDIILHASEEYFYYPTHPQDYEFLRLDDNGHLCKAYSTGYIEVLECTKENMSAMFVRLPKDFDWASVRED